METLVLKLTGPMQSYGNDSYYNYRYTDRLPRKSMIVGFLGACLGIGRDDDEAFKELNKLGVATRLDQGGQMLRDFHMVHEHHTTKKSVWITERYYMTDTVVVIGISSSDTDLIKKLEYAVKNPVYAPFIGRKCNPVNYDLVLGVYEGNALGVIKGLEWQARDWYKGKQGVGTSVQLEITADGFLDNQKGTKVVQDRVESFNPKNRLYGYRAVIHDFVEVVNGGDTTDHDIMSYI